MGLHGPLIAPDCRYDGLVARPYEPLADDRLERRPDQTLSSAVASEDIKKRCRFSMASGTPFERTQAPFNVSEQGKPIEMRAIPDDSSASDYR
jgi:hypothetical protein